MPSELIRCSDVLIRDSKLLFKSPEQQHGFNFPFQLGCRGHPADTPQSAQTYLHAVKENDVLILATDGFFDNIFVEDVVSIVNAQVSKSSLSNPSLSKEMADILAQRAFVLSQAQKDGPFAFNARKACAPRLQIRSFPFAEFICVYFLLLGAIGLMEGNQTTSPLLLA